jgi:hypothetical protein
MFDVLLTPRYLNASTNSYCSGLRHTVRLPGRCDREPPV